MIEYVTSSDWNFKKEGRRPTYITDIGSGSKTSSERSLYIVNRWTFSDIANS